MSTTTIDGFAGRTLSDIAASLPGATAVFRKRKMDFCCSGGVPLAEAAAAKGLDLASLEAELEALDSRAAPADADQPTEALIGRILERYHAVHRRELPELARLARRVEAVHRENAHVPAGLADLLEEIGQEMENHMLKEEHVLFPLILAGHGSSFAFASTISAMST